MQQEPYRLRRAKSLPARAFAALLCAGSVALALIVAGASGPTVSGSAAATPADPCPVGFSDNASGILASGSEPTFPSSGAVEFTLGPIAFTEPTCQASVRITAAQGPTRSFAFPAPGAKTQTAFRVTSADVCQLKKIQKATSTATGHRCVVQFLTVRFVQLNGPATAAATRDTCVLIGLLARKSGAVARAKNVQTHLTAQASRMDTFPYQGSLLLTLSYAKSISTNPAQQAADVPATPVVLNQCNK